MKTNQLMDIAFSEGNVQVFHKTAMGDLTQLWRVGNVIRVNEGKAFQNLTQFLSSEKTKEFIAVCEAENGNPCIQKTGKGRNARTWASIHLMIYAAEYLSPFFHYEVIDAFINGKILEYRDLSGSEFKALNISIDNYLPDREGRDNKGVYIQVARLLKEKVGLSSSSWNEATAENLKERLVLENRIVDYLKMGFVKNYHHLKELIEKM